MKTATVKLKISNVGSTIVKYNITPPELMLLVAQHHPHVGGNPVVSLKEEIVKLQKHNDERQVEEVLDPKTKTMKAVLVNPMQASPEWTTGAERTRLRNIYRKDIVDSLFPGRMPEMPTAFDEAQALGVDSELPASQLISDKGGKAEVLSGGIDPIA